MTKGTGIRMERAPKPGANWEIEISRSGEMVVADDGDGDLEGYTVSLNREQRRAMKRAERKRGR